MKKNYLLIGRLAIMLACLLATPVLFAQQSQTFAGAGTYSFQVPAGVTQLDVQAWGGGGRGGSRVSGSNGYGGGGGGAFASSTLTVTPGQTYTIVVGAGSTSAASAGGSSYFNNTTTLLAVGGQSVANNITIGAAGGAASSCVGTIRYSGGNGNNGLANTYGGGGGAGAGPLGNGLSGTGTNLGGIGLTSGGGNGGAGRTGSQGDGTAGSAPGGGGGGALRTSTGSPVGGNGGDGQVIIRWTCPAYGITSTAVPATSCSGNSATVTLTGSATSLPTGTYTITYNLSGANAATGSTATMTVSTAGSGTFTTSSLTNAGNTTVTVTNIASGGASPFNCSTNISSSNTATVNVIAIPAQPSVITGSATPCVGTSVTYSVTNVAGVTYTWAFPSGWTQTGGGTTNSVTVTVGSTGGNVSVTPSNACGSGTARTLAVTPLSIPATPSSITGSTAPCNGSSVSYSVTNVTGVTYNWTFPSGWTQTAGGTTNSVTVTVGASSGVISVTAGNTCGTSTASTLSVVSTTLPSQPSTITGPSPTCAGTSQTYSVTAVAGVSYSWTVPSGWTITAGTGTNSITVTVGTTGGTLSVTPSTGCGSGPARTLSVTVNAAPTITSTTPGSRVGFGPVVLGATASSGIVNWYATASDTTILGTGTSFTTPDLVTTSIFYAEAVSGGCSSTPRTPVTATVNLPEANVKGNGFDIADEDVTPITTDYTILGTTPVATSITRTYTIQNTGTVALTVGSISITGTNASAFTVLTAPASTIAAGSTTTFTIRFTAAFLGNHDATLSFATNDNDENPYNFSIRGIGGTGLYPEMNITGNGVTIIDGDSGPTTADHSDFGTVTIPGTVTRTFTIQNTGAAPLLLTGTPVVEITGSANFTLVTAPATTIAAGGSTTFQVTFSPSTTGSSVAIISIINSDDDESIYDFTIQGAALISGREIDIQGNEVSIVAGDTTPSIVDQTNFGVTDTTTAIAIPFNVYSFGTSTLSLTTTVGISGTNASMFTATALPGTLASGAVTSFVITFTPNTSLGVKTATITVTSDDPNEGTYSFAVSAEIQASSTPSTGPGGVTGNLRLWLKATSNLSGLNDGDAISTWADQTTGSTKSAIAQSLSEPTFRNNPAYNVNFNPVVHFDGGDAMYGGQGFYNSDMYIVVKTANTISYLASPQDIFCGDDIATNRNSQDVTGFQMGNTSVRHANETWAYNQGAQTSYGIAEISTTKTYNGVNIFNPRKNVSSGRMELICNGGAITGTEVFTGTYKDINNSRYWLGRSEFFDSSFNGYLLEVICYNSRNTDTNRNRIETYLALKYGITLGVNGTSVNYVSSNGTTVYSAASGFNYNIAGIGRDDNSGLNQKQSRTENSSYDVTMGLATIEPRNSDNNNTFDTDRSFLVWGHNNATLTAQAPVVVNMSAGISGLTSEVEFISIGRVWRVVETGGDVKTVKVSVPEDLLTSTVTPPGAFFMFISSSPIFNPTAEYRIMTKNGVNLETTYDFSGTKYITFGYAPEKTFVRSIDFDGVDDYLDAGNVLNLGNNFTVSAWIKRSGANQSIVSKRNAGFTSGYDLRINNAGRVEMSWMNGTLQTITSTVSIPTNVWHNVAVTFDGTTARLYIDGVLNVSQALSTVPDTNESFLIAAAGGTSTTSFFDGTIDEVRVFGTALSAAQLRYIMNQEVRQHSDGTVNGSIVPQSITSNDIKTVAWSQLRAYYPMSTYTYTNAKDESVNGYTASLRNLTTVDYQTAPLPYVSNADGNWNTAGTWKNSSTQDLPYALSIVDGATRVTWNIVDIDHNVVSTGNKDVLSLDLASGKTLTASNDTRIGVSHYLLLNGKLDLVGKSQLVQSQNSDLAITSSGSIERDQQGSNNVYNYNYWSSPVGATSTTANNTDYTISGVLRDGTDENNPLAINWTSGYNGAAGTPITLSSSWIYKFGNLSNDYANWQYVGQDGTMRAAEGFTMKGSGAGSSQNYVFTGKPNNGLIELPIAASNLNLCGNPYPSALDANTFITDNLGVLDGTLYFWIHYSTNNTHNLADYQGGYAARTLVGGTNAVSPPGVSGLGSNSRVPQRYIPVGQAFFVTANSTGGTITFNNNQRAYVKEDNSQSGVMFRSGNSAAASLDDLSETNVQEDNFPTVRIGFTMPNDYHRGLLLGFMGANATDGIDVGYDAVLFDELPYDMYFVNGENRLVISGEGDLDVSRNYPLGVKVSEKGFVKFSLDEMLHFPTAMNCFLYDAYLGIYHNLSQSEYELTLPEGVYNQRFYIRFSTANTLGTADVPTTATTGIRYESSKHELVIEPAPSTTVTSALLFNMLGQQIANWELEKMGQEMIRIPITKATSGTYIVKLLTSMGPVSRKIVIQ